MKEKFTLYELLTNFNEVKKFNLAKKLNIFILSSESSDIESSDIMSADIKEYYLSDVPLYLLCKIVKSVYHDENDIVVF